MAERKTDIPIPPKGTRGGWMPGGPVFRALTRPFYNREMKRLADPTATEQHKFMGFPVAVVTTVGAKTGKEHASVLGAFPDGPDAWLLIASKGGAATHPGWFFNIAKNPDKVWIQVANRKLHVKVKSLQGKERDDAYARVAAASKQYAGYPQKTDRVIPVLRLTPAE